MKKKPFNLEIKPGKYFDLRISQDDSMFVISNPKLSIYVYNTTFEKALQDLAEQIQFIWDEFVKNETTPLTKDAQQFKVRMKRIFKEIYND